MTKEYTYLTPAQYARKIGVSVQTVRHYIQTKRIDGIINPASGVVLIPFITEKPKVLRPWENTERINRNKNCYK
jgi:hypothetical protein